MMLQWHATWLAIAFGLTVACPSSPAQDRPLTAFASDPGAAADDLLENAAMRACLPMSRSPQGLPKPGIWSSKDVHPGMEVAAGMEGAPPVANALTARP